MLRMMSKMFSLKNPLVFTQQQDLNLQEIENVYAVFNIPAFHFDEGEFALKFLETNFSLMAIFISAAKINEDTLNKIIKVSKGKVYLIIYNIPSQLSFKYSKYVCNRKNYLDKLISNYLVKLFLKIKITVQNALVELNSEEYVEVQIAKFKGVRKEKSIQKAQAILVTPLNYKTIILFSLVLLQTFVSFSFIGQNDIQTLKISAVTIANREQRKNETDKYVNMRHEDSSIKYADHLNNQYAHSKKYKNLYPYVKLLETELIFNNVVTSEVTTLTVNDFGLEEAFMRGYPVSLYASKHYITPHEGFEHGVIITSSYADKIIGEIAEVKTYSDLIGKEIVDKKGNGFSINNIIYVTDINENTEIGDLYFRYHETNVRLGKHLLNLYGDYVFVINPPQIYKDESVYNITCYPQGNGLVKYMNDINFEANETLELIFITAQSGVYIENSFYGNLINVYKHPPAVNILNIIILSIFSLIFVILAIKIFIDELLKHFNNKLLLIGLSPYFILIVYVLTIRNIAKDVFIQATANLNVVLYMLLTLIIFGGIITFQKIKSRKRVK